MKSNKIIAKISAGYKVRTGREFPGLHRMGNNVRMAWLAAAKSVLTGNDFVLTFMAFHAIPAQREDVMRNTANKSSAAKIWKEIHDAMVAA